MLRLTPWLLLLAPTTANAQFTSIITSGISGCDFLTGRITSDCIPSFIAHLIQILFSLIGIFFLVNVMYAGYEIAIGAATGGGREAGLRRLQWAIIGLAVCICSFLILDLVLTILIG